MYGRAPKVDQVIAAEYWDEFCFIQDLMIKQPGSDIIFPDHLIFFKCFITSRIRELASADDAHVYISIKHKHVEASTHFNRPGWHSDGFGTDDVTFLWSDVMPTEFCIQDFDITEDCEISMREMEDQARNENIRTYGNNALLELDKYCIHRTPTAPYSGFRKFIKVVVSKNKFNLKGNAKNPFMDYSGWEWCERGQERNHPTR